MSRRFSDSGFYLLLPLLLLMTWGPRKLDLAEKTFPSGVMWVQLLQTGFEM